MSAWIEIPPLLYRQPQFIVALLVSAWIEIVLESIQENAYSEVALLVSAWIEIKNIHQAKEG